MNYEIINQNEWLYPDSRVSRDGAKEIHLHTAKGAYISTQILFNHLETGVTFRWNCTTPEGISLEVYQQVDVLCEKNTGPVAFCVSEESGESAEGYTTRQAPFRVYDALKPLSPAETSKMNAKTGALYLAFFIEEEALARMFDFTFDIQFTDVVHQIPVSLQIFDVIVPKEKNLYISNWYRLDNIATQHQLEMWSKAHWGMIEQYAELMARTRQTHFWIPNEVREITKTAKGDYEFKFDRTKRLIELFLSKGFTHIEGNLIYARADFWDDSFIVHILDETYPAKSPESYRFVSQYLKAWRTFLEENNWLHLLHQHVGDEPTCACKDEYRILSGIVRKHLPSVPLMEAIETYDLDGAVDIWIPKNNYFQEQRDKFEWIRSNGEELWFYTCCYPGGHYLNRLWDMPLIRTRLLHWGNYRYDLKGYLHWGFNWCDTDKDPFNQTDIFFPPGDTHLSYPAEGEVWGSMRLEAMRAGVQDYELFYQLAKKDKALADELCKSCLATFDQPNEDIAHFEAIRKKLLIALERK